MDTVFQSIVPFVDFVRGGVFRAGTYPSREFGWKLALLREVHKRAISAGKKNVVDVLDIRDIETIDPYTEVYQVGMRQAQHYALLRELGGQRKPVILKRGSWMTYDETMGAMEHLLSGGNQNVFLCERGSVSHLDHVRWELSISTIAKVKRATNLPIIVDASHGSGVADLVSSLALAGIAAGADGLLVECHPDPRNSLSDAAQALSFDEFHSLALKAKEIYALVRD